jgi:UDP-GlcNAc:undecaprenyl-phosphate GlcNAc-1-phosphate transferase
VLTINAVNMVDGWTGSAAGIVAIAAGAFFIFSYLLWVQEGVGRAATPSLVTAILVGMCLGFLPHNFYPSRIFMGDSGAMLIGLLLAASTITMTGQVPPQVFQDVSLVPPCCCSCCRCSSSWSRSPTSCSPSSAVRARAARRSPPTSSTCTTGCLEIGHSHRRAGARDVRVVGPDRLRRAGRRDDAGWLPVAALSVVSSWSSVRR